MSGSERSLMARVLGREVAPLRSVPFFYKGECDNEDGGIVIFFGRKFHPFKTFTLEVAPKEWAEAYKKCGSNKSTAALNWLLNNKYPDSIPGLTNN